MGGLLDQLRPTSPAGRLTVAGVSGAIGLIGVFMSVGWTYAEAITPFFVLAIGLVFSAVAFREAAAVVSMAESGPETRERRTESTTDERESVPEADPIDVLQRRYAEGELSTEEFEERVDRLVDLDVPRRESTDPDVERELERT